MKYFKKALENRRVRNGKVFVFLGPVPNPDICVLIADFFLKISSIKWSIVAGYHQKKLVIIFRSDGLRKNAGNVAEKGFAEFGSVITSYSIHYTKLYESRTSVSFLFAGRGFFDFCLDLIHDPSNDFAVIFMVNDRSYNFV